MVAPTRREIYIYWQLLLMEKRQNASLVGWVSYLLYRHLFLTAKCSFWWSVHGKCSSTVVVYVLQFQCRRRTPDVSVVLAVDTLVQVQGPVPMLVPSGQLSVDLGARIDLGSQR